MSQHISTAQKALKIIPEGQNNRALHQGCKTRKTNLSTVWLDYKKTYDSMPHTLIVEYLALYKVKCVHNINQELSGRQHLRPFGWIGVARKLQREVS